MKKNAITKSVALMCLFSVAWGLTLSARAAQYNPTTGEELVAVVNAARQLYADQEEPSEIVLAAGTYKTTTEIVLDFPVVVRGATGNPADVTVTKTDGGDVTHRKFTLDHPDARLESITVSGAYLHYFGSNYSRLGAGVRISNSKVDGKNSKADTNLGTGGIVSNCVFTANKVPYKNCSAIVYVNGPADKTLVTCCVVTNNSVWRATDSSNGESALGSIVHVDSGRFTSSIVGSNKVYNTVTTVKQDETSVVEARGGSVENCLVIANSVYDSYDPTVVRVLKTGKVSNTVIADNSVLTSSWSRADWPETSRYWAGVVNGFVKCIAKGEDISLPNETCICTNELGYFDFAAHDYRITRRSVQRASATMEDVLTTGADLLGKPRVNESGLLDIGPIAYDPSIVKIAGVCEGGDCFEDEEAVFRVTVDEGFGDDPTYYWTMKSTDGGSDTTYATKSLVLKTTIAKGEYEVVLSVSNLTAGTGSSVVLDQPVRSYQRTFYAKPGNQGAAAPYATEETAAGDLQTAINAVTRDGAEVVALKGVYEITTNVMVRAHQIVLRGATGNPEDVIVRNITTSKMSGSDIWNESSSPYGDGRCLVLDAGPAARVESMTFEDGRGLYSVHIGCGLYLASWTKRGLWPDAGRGGVVSNCVVRNCNAGINKYGLVPGIFARGPYLVTHTVVSNCQAGAGNINGGYFSGIGMDLGDGARAEHCLIANNRLDFYRAPGASAPQYGRATVGGVMVRDDSILRFSTIVGNKGAMVGGVNANGTAARIENCIVLGNRVGPDDARAESLACEVTTNRFSSWAMMTWAATSELIQGNTDWASGNIAGLTAAEVAYVEATPEAVSAAFKNTLADYAAPGATGILSTKEETFKNAAKNNFQLRSRSAAVDRITPSEAGGMPSVDLLGNPRLFGPAYDLGCYETKIRGMMMIVR